MDYIICNSSDNREIRISNKEIEGRVIYKGHKLAIPENILAKILYYSYEKSSNLYYFIDYKKWKDIYGMQKINNKMYDCWFKERDTVKALNKSFETLISLVKENLGSDRNIYIVEN